MTIFYSTELAGIASTPVVKADATKGYGARIRRYRGTFTMATQTTGDTIVVAVVPAGMTFAFGILTPSVTMGASATVAIGITGATGKYRAAATATAITPEVFGVQAANGAATPLTADETIFITIAVASLAAAGAVTVDLYFTNG